MFSKYSRPKYCFNVFLKVWTDGDFLISDGNLFQTKGPWYLILFCLTNLVLVDGIAKSDMEPRVA